MTRNVKCQTEACPARGIARTVPDAPAGPGLVSRPRLFCAACGAEVVDVDRQPPVEQATRQAPENAARRTRPATKRKG